MQTTFVQGGAESGAQTVQNLVQQPAADDSNDWPETTEAPENSGASADS
jgi:hypothetical protein